MADRTVDPPAGALQENGFRCGADVLDAFCDAAAARRDLGIGCAGHAPFVLVQAVVGKNGMGVAADEAGDDYPPSTSNSRVCAEALTVAKT